MTNATDRKRAQRARDKEIGVKEYLIRTHKDDVEKVRAYVRELNLKRGI